MHKHTHNKNTTNSHIHKRRLPNHTFHSNIDNDLNPSRINKSYSQSSIKFSHIFLETFFSTHRQTHAQSRHPYYISQIIILASHSIALDEPLQIARSNMSRHIVFRSLTDNGDRSINLNGKHV